MKALEIEQFGTPSEFLKVVELDDIPPGPDEVQIRVEAAAINPSDVGNVNGKFPTTRLPRIVGRDFAGTVVAGPDDVLGIPVWGSGGDIGFTRHGSHAEFINIPAAAVSRRPANLSAEEAAAVGVPFVTAWSALELARFQPGESVIVSGAAGAVGSAAAELVHAKGGQVIALVRDELESKKPDRTKIDAVAHSSRDDLESVVREATGGKGADVALNGIGASVLPAFLSSMAAGGRMTIYSVAFGGREATLDLFALYRKSHQLLGLDTVAIDVVQGARILSQLRPLFESGKLGKPHIAERYPLSDGPRAYDRVASAGGKVVLQM
ncbi:MAG TPA: zinc-binding alcohol dehydrogenase family protein [Bryobacteraceae bacterium]|nr:zinc-binding alcohol dehydrogenase family protein [Bryobacteraceae bacterium]